MEENKPGLTQSEENAQIETKVIKEISKNLANSVTYDPGLEHVLVIRHDKPKQELLLRERVNFTGSGNIDTVSRYLEKRVSKIDQLNTTVLIDRDKMSIKIHSDETDHWGDKLSGKLEAHPDFKAFEINSGELWKPVVLGDFLRMNRAKFISKAENLSLVNLLKSFEAKVDTTIADMQAQNGNKKVSREQVVTSNIPDAFKISVSLFKGFKPVEIEIEIHIDPYTLQCSLQSPDAKEKVDNIINTIIDDEIEKIEQLAPQLLIIEQ